jgi:tetratricopeptide (TPR) repeat protein
MQSSYHDSQTTSDQNVESLVARANAHFNARRFTEATEGYRQVLDVQPRHVHALHLMGLACVHMDKLDSARGYLFRARQAAPERADLLEHAGLVAAAQGDLANAERLYRNALALTPSTASLHRNLADCLRLCGKLHEALLHYKLCIEIEPALHHAIRAMAQIHAQLGNVDDAADHWLRAWPLNPSDMQDGLDLIAALAKARRTSQLVVAIAQVRSHFSSSAEALKSLSYVLNMHDLVGEALSVARQGLAIDPHHPLLHHNAARALSLLGRLAESRPHSMEAARLLPDNPYLQFHLAGVQLGLGEFDEGWKRYRSFYEIPENQAQLVSPPFPQWQGEPVRGCRFLLVGEQGRGDEIQFIRFVEWLHREGATVDVLVSEPIACLASTLKNVRHVFTRIPPGPYDYWSHMLKVPAHMKLNLAMLPYSKYYLTATPKQIDRWRSRLDALSPKPSDADNRRVGVVWAGGPNHVLDRFRSIPLEALKPLFTLPGVAWYSLQKGAGECDPEALAPEFDIHTLGPVITDFTDTLAIIEGLDLLITVDTSVAHLAGAAGTPVWTLIPACADWRWLNGRTDSPWYPSMRLFRQREMGHWAPVIEDVRLALLDWSADW